VRVRRYGRHEYGDYSATFDQILTITVEPLRLEIATIDFRDENGSSLELEVSPFDGEELADFVTLVMYKTNLKIVFTNVVGV
jgi:hypothetical protein